MVDDRYLPGLETPAGQEIRLAAGLADFVHHPRRIRAFAIPALIILGLGVGAIVVAVIVHLLSH